MNARNVGVDAAAIRTRASTLRAQIAAGNTETETLVELCTCVIDLAAALDELAVDVDELD
jgi:hypothetical protein